MRRSEYRSDVNHLYGTVIPCLFFSSSVQFIHSGVSDSATPWTAACQDSLSTTNFQISQEAGQVVWYSQLLNFPQFVVIHTVKGFGEVDKAEIDVLLEFSCFFDMPTDVGNVISGSSAFSKSSLNVWKSTFHILQKSGLENFEHYFASV